MEIEKEGLHTYGVYASVCNEYFLSVEYPAIQYNRPRTLLPVLLREQDGAAVLLYDISDAKSLKEITEGRNLSKEDCRQLLYCMELLLYEMEELMLSPDHIRFLPEYIYQTGDKDFQWMYCPDEKNDLEKQVQDFFAWMLPEIDYGDSGAVRFIYHVYWSVRNRDLSKGLLRECLNYEAEMEETPKENKQVSYDEFFADRKEKERTEGREIERGNTIQEKTGLEEIRGRKINCKRTEREEMSWEQTEENKQVEKKIWIFIQICFTFFCGLLGMAVLFFFMITVWQGFTAVRLRYLLIGVTAFLLLLEGNIQIHKKRTAACSKETALGEDPLKEYEAQRDFSQEGTVRLDQGKMYVQPILKKQDTGEVCMLHTFPFYIGNETGLNQLPIADKTVSRRHAVIQEGEVPGTYKIQDLESTNGTWVNHDRIGRHPVMLQNKSVLRFASCEYQFEILEEFVSF